MTDSYVQLQADSTGKKVDTSELTVAGNVVERQRMVVAADTDTAAFAFVGNSAPSSTDYGIAVRAIGGGGASATTVYQGTTPWTMVASSTGGNQPVNVITGTIASLTSGTIFQGTSPWVTQAATSGGNQPVNVVTGTLASLTSGTVFQGTSPWVTQAATSGGSQPVSLGATIVNVQGATSGGNQPVSLGASIVNVQAATSGGNQPVSLGAAIVSVQAASSGGAQPVAQSSTPWIFVASTTGGNQPVTVSATVNVFNASTSGAIQTVLHATSGGNQPVTLGAAIVTIVASTTGGAQQVIQSTIPWTVINSATSGAIQVTIAATSGGSSPTNVTQLAGTTFAGPYMPTMSAQTVNSWNKNSSPAAGAIAVVNSSAQASGVRNVCRSITLSLIPSSSATVVVAVPQIFSLFDGTSTTTILWTFRCVLPATTGVDSLNAQAGVYKYFPELHIAGTAATQMTLGTSATAATVQATISMQGYTLTT